MALENVQIEISGLCNAKCPYCFTGQNNRRGKKNGRFMNLDDFKEVVSILEEKGIIDYSTMISLYNYGEPLLCPDFPQIIDFLEMAGYSYDISTNASILVDDDVLHRMKHLTRIQFSVCGMTQESYDKIHGFSIDRILYNIEKMIKEIHRDNRTAECLLKLQMYKFNESEFNNALEFSKKNNMTVIPLHAIYANLEQQKEMIKAYTREKKYTHEDLIVDYLPELLNRGDRTKCIEHNGLVIDDNFNVALCCMVTKEMPQYYWKSLSELNMNNIEERRTDGFCLECIKQGVSCSICNTPSYKGELLKNIEHVLEKNKDKKIVLISEGGLGKSFRDIFTGKYDFEICDSFERFADGYFYIFATKRWWEYLDKNDNRVVEEYADYLIYNTYIRQI